MMPQAGNVRIQVRTISLAIPQRTAERRCVEPTPMMEVLIQCVVLTGMPKNEAISIMLAAPTVAANPCTGRSVVILSPNVLITRQPPIAIPELIEAAESTITQGKIVNSLQP